MNNGLDLQSNGTLNLYKRRSETPLQTIERYRLAHPEHAKAKMTYAGRLDPMAEGLLLVLSGEKNKEREAYTGLDKDYEFEFLLGVDTDTHDLLGKIVATTGGHEIPTEALVKKAFGKYTGAFMQKYPAYSSKVVDGVPLFDLARKGKIGSIVMPEHQVNVSTLDLVGSRKMSEGDFRAFLVNTITAVHGDFRQKEILEVWERYLENAPSDFVIYKAKVSCGSGFYVRQLVWDVGKDLKVGAVTVSILRTRVGEFKLEDSIR